MGSSASYFRCLDFDFQSINAHSQTLSQLWTNDIDGIIIRDLVSKPILDHFLQLIFDTESNLPSINYYWGQVFGRVLTSQLDDIDEYFHDASLYDMHLPQIWGDPPTSWPKFLSYVLSILSGKPSLVPQLCNGKTLLSSTIRVISDGKELTTHCGNQFAHNTSKLNELGQISILDDQVSYFLLLQSPSEGGELSIYDARWSDRSQYLYPGSTLHQSIESRRSHMLDLKAGDLLIFQGGQIYHRVERIRGSIPRITLGGFITPSTDMQNLFFWS